MVKKAFGRFSLEQTGVVIGWFGLITSLIYHVSWLMLPINEIYHRDSPDYEHLYPISFIFADEFSFMAFLLSVTSISLLWGINMKQKLFLFPWLIVMGLLVPFFLGFGIFALTFHPLMYITEFEEILFNILVISFGIFFVYLWYIVYSLYQKMTIDDKDAKEKQLPKVTELIETPYNQLV